MYQELYYITYDFSGAGIIRSPHQFKYSACPLFGNVIAVLSHCVKPRPHLVKSDPASVLCTTTSSPNHAMPSFSLAGSSTIHTTTSPPQHICSLSPCYCMQPSTLAGGSMARLQIPIQSLITS
ncbi:hypothetical protein BDR03DRAFT_254654 [Suillus americanus]|nr:hypothetical protein BDR03DRAFT_254654 [Suillus americanus]